MLYLPLSIWYIFDVLSAKTKSLFDLLIAFFLLILKSVANIWNFNMLTKSHKSRSNETISLILGHASGHGFLLTHLKCFVSGEGDNFYVFRITESSFHYAVVFP